MHVYRLQPLTEDRAKVEYALNTTLHREENLRVVLQNSDTGGLMPEGFFISNVSWDDCTVRTREFGSFKRRLRQTLPDDEVPGFGSWDETQSLLREVVEQDRRDARRCRPEGECGL